MPEPMPAWARVSRAYCSSSARCASAAALRAAARGSGPSSSMASSNSGMSDWVSAAPLSRVSAAMSSSDIQGANRRNWAGLENSWSISHGPVIGSQARFNVCLTVSFMRSCCMTSVSSGCSGV